MRYIDILNILNRINICNALSKGECMHNYKFDDETTNKVLATYQSKKTNDDFKNLMKDIEKVKNTFVSADIPDYIEPNFERLPEINKSTEDIKKEAEDSLLDYKNNALVEIENDFSAGVNKVESKKTALEEANKENKKSIKDYFVDAQQDVNDNAINRGLARSSIVINQMDAFEKEELSAYDALDKEFSDNLNALDFELNSLVLQKEQALQGFDIAYAVKLSDKINKLNKELLEEQNKVLKYNNEIAEKEKKYLEQYNELVSDIQNKNIDKDAKVFDLISKYGQKALDNYKKNKLYEVLDNYFAGVDSSEISAIINGNEELKNALGADLQDVLERYK